MYQKMLKILKENPEITLKESIIISTINDVEMMRQNLKPYIWENIPIIGSYCYLFRIAAKASRMIRRQPLRREINRCIFVFMAMSAFLWSFIILVTPWSLHLIIKLAVDQVQNNLDQGKIPLIIKT